MISKKSIDNVEFERLQIETFGYFLDETNPENGLVKDKDAPCWPSGIAATGMALAIYTVAVEGVVYGVQVLPEAGCRKNTKRDVADMKVINKNFLTDNNGK